MRRPIVTDIKRTGRGEGIPFMLTGVVIDTRAGTGMCRVRLDNLSRRTIKNVIIPTGAELQSGDRVLLANLGQDPRWIIITRVQEGSDLGQHLSPTNQGTTQLHPPNNFSVTGIDGAVKAEWDCWAGNTVCWDVQHNDSASDSGASTRYTRGSLFFYFSTALVTRYIRVRAVRYDVELNQAYYSAWSAWSSATSTPCTGFQASATPIANWLLALDSNVQFPSEVIPSETIKLPSGSNKQLQYNNSGAFGGATGFEWQSASPNLIVNAQNAAHAPFVVKGAVAQSASLQEWQNSGGSVQSRVGSQGHIGIGVAPTDLVAFGTALFPTSAGSQDIRAANSTVFATINGASVNLFGGFYDARQNFGSAGAFQIVGIRGTAQNVTSNLAGYVIGGDFTASVSGSGGASNLWGFRGVATAAGTTNSHAIGAKLYAHRTSTTAGWATGLDVIVQALATGNIATGHGIVITTPIKAGGATFTNSYGLYVQNQNVAATLNYAIYTNAGDIRLMSTPATDKLGFWGAAPVVRTAAYTPTNVTPDRSYDADATSTAELADVLGTLIVDLQSYGLLG